MSLKDTQRAENWTIAGIATAAAVAGLSVWALFGHARGAEAPTTSTPHSMTVRQVIEVTTALQALDTRQDFDKDHNVVSVPSGYHFTGAARMTMALDVARGSEVLRTYQSAVSVLRVQLAGAGKDVPKEKLDDFNTELEKMQSAPAGVELGHIKVADLCLDAAPPACPQANPIPVSTLSLLQPILDQ
jgi:hypothetical protein